MTSKQVTSPPWNSRRGAQAKKWFGHCAGRSPCAHSIGKFFLCYIVLFLLETSAPGLSGHYWYMYFLFGTKYFTCPVGLLKLRNIITLDMTTLLFIEISQILTFPLLCLCGLCKVPEESAGIAIAWSTQRRPLWSPYLIKYSTKPIISNPSVLHSFVASVSNAKRRSATNLLYLGIKGPSCPKVGFPNPKGTSLSVGGFPSSSGLITPKISVEKGGSLRLPQPVVPRLALLRYQGEEGGLDFKDIQNR